MFAFGVAVEVFFVPAAFLVEAALGEVFFGAPFFVVVVVLDEAGLGLASFVSFASLASFYDVVSID